MKIFLPFQKDQNPYLDEIIRYSVHTFVYDSWENYHVSYPVVNIHWPEAIFDWKEPDDDQLEELERAISNWKQNSVLVYTKHDFERNKGTTRNFTRLFDLIEEKADVFIHLGKFSQKFYFEKHPEARHEIIYHPLYSNSFRIPGKEEARQKLNIYRKSLVITAPGNIRSYEERDMILKAFKALPIKNKVLIATNVHSEIRYDFPGRIRLKKIFDVKKFLIKSFRRKFRPPHYIFTYNTLEKEELETKMAAADVVLVPRVRLLNSGNVFLGLTFGKILAGPACGNIEEQLRELDFPVFNPGDNISVVKALEQAIELSEKGFKLNEEIIEKYHPENVAKKMDLLFNEIIKP